MAQLFALENSHSLKNIEPVSVETLASFDEASVLPLRGTPRPAERLGGFVFVCERLGDETWLVDRVDGSLVPAFFAGARVHPLTQLEGRERNGWRGLWWVLSCAVLCVGCFLLSVCVYLEPMYM